MLCYQGCDDTQSSEVNSQLEVQRVVVGFVQALVRQVELTFTLAAYQTGFRIQHLFDVVTDTEVSPVHMTGNDKQHGDRQVVMSNVSQPQGFCLGVEAAQESQNCCSSALGCPEYVASSIWVFGVYAPVTSEERSQTSRVRRGRQEVVPTYVLSARFGDSNVNHVTSPSQRADTEQTSQVVVEARFSIFEPRQAGAVLRLEVQPTSKQEDRSQQ